MDFAISLYDALVAINVPREKANAVVSALEHDMTTALATKDDLKAQTSEFDLKLKALNNSIVIRLGAIVIAAMAGLEALHKFL
jgi:hypothetical protein